MVTKVTNSLGATHNTMVLGSGLSGMVAAYISARAAEDNAVENDGWHAQQAFRRGAALRKSHKASPGGSGPALAS